MITDGVNARNTESNQLKEKFVKSKIAKEIYNFQHKAFITKTMKSELKACNTYNTTQNNIV